MATTTDDERGASTCQVLTFIEPVGVLIVIMMRMAYKLIFWMPLVLVWYNNNNTTTTTTKTTTHRHTTTTTATTPPPQQPQQQRHRHVAGRSASASRSTSSRLPYVSRARPARSISAQIRPSMSPPAARSSLRSGRYSASTSQLCSPTRQACIIYTSPS